MKRFGLTLALVAALAPAASGVEYHFYHPDALGTNSVVTDREGRVVQRSVHSPYGEQRSVSSGSGPFAPRSSDLPRHRYTGQEHDDESDLNYFGARYQDPAIGRFLSVDPGMIGAYAGPTFKGLPLYPGGLNLQGYVLNRPTVAVDPTGEYWETPWDAGNVALSYIAFEQDPGLGTAAGLIWDSLAFVAPFIPAGAGMARYIGGGATSALSDQLVKQRFPFLDSVNPSGCTTNCVATVASVEMQFRFGAKSDLKALFPAEFANGVDARVLSALAGGRKLQRAGGIDNLIDHMESLGEGARGVVLAMDSQTQGKRVLHAFNIVNDGGNVFLLDGQTGTAVKNLGTDAAPWKDLSLYFSRTDDVAP